MRHTSVTIEAKGGDMSRALRFAGGFLLALLGVVVAFRLIAASVAFSRWTGGLVLVIIASALYSTASQWVRWLPGLLIFGIINSLVGLMTHHTSTNPQVAVPAGIAGLLVAFYSVGCIVSYHYDAVVDRLAFLLYLFCMIYPTFAAKDITTLTPVVAWSVSIGMAALLASFAAHRARWRKKSVDG
jgi:hypothetical protein